MRNLLLAVCGLFILAGPVSQARADAKDDELAKMKGTWTIVSGSMDGQPMPPEEMDGRTFVIEGDTMSMNKGDKKDPAKVTSIDTTKKPAWIDLVGPKGGGDEKVEGIYKLDGDTLELCFKHKGRPADFNPGKEVVYIKLKRQK